jgi:hypothetical protein
MKDYEIDVAFNGKISIPNFVKVGQQFQELSNVGTDNMAILIA